MVQEAKICQQHLPKESIDEIKSLINGLNVQQSKIFKKQKLVEMTNDGVVAGSSEKLLWG